MQTGILTWVPVMKLVLSIPTCICNNQHFVHINDHDNSTHLGYSLSYGHCPAIHTIPRHMSRSMQTPFHSDNTVCHSSPKKTYVISHNATCTIYTYSYQRLLITAPLSRFSNSQTPDDTLLIHVHPHPIHSFSSRYFNTAYPHHIPSFPTILPLNVFNQPPYQCHLWFTHIWFPRFWVMIYPTPVIGNITYYHLSPLPALFKYQQT